MARSLKVRNAAEPAVSPQHPSHSIHHETDHAAQAVTKFCARHPEYARLAPEVVEQAMGTYRTEEEHETLGKLRDEGVQVWDRRRWSDEA